MENTCNSACNTGRGHEPSARSALRNPQVLEAHRDLTFYEYISRPAEKPPTRQGRPRNYRRLQVRIDPGITRTTRARLCQWALHAATPPYGRDFSIRRR